MAISDEAREAAGRELASLATTVEHVADDAHTRYRSTYLLDQLFHDVVVAAAPALFVEAGAFEADTSLAIAADLPGCRVVAFEANPYNHAHFSAERDYPAGGVDYRHQALATEPGEVRFQVMVGSSERDVDKVAGNNSLLRRTDGGYLGDVEYEEVTVPATTLDAEFPDGPWPAAMWMDVEGATGIVLAGARGFLDHLDVVKVEVETTESWEGQWQAADVVAELAGHGLRPAVRDAQGRDQYNLILLRDRVAQDPAVRRLLEDHGETSRRTLSRAQGRLRRHPVARRVGRALLGRRRLS